MARVAHDPEWFGWMAACVVIGLCQFPIISPRCRSFARNVVTTITARVTSLWTIVHLCGHSTVIPSR